MATSLLVIGLFCAINLASAQDSLREEFSHEIMTAVGGSVIIPCRTNLSSPVDWMFQPNANVKEIFVCYAGNIRPEYSSRISVDSPASGDYHLKIAGVQLSDAGIYTCVEDEGAGRRHQLKLRVSNMTRQDTSREIGTVVGGSAIILCHTNFSSRVDWMFQPSADAMEVFVCYAGKIRPQYSSRISLVSPAPGDYHLNISSVQTTDAGFYTCVEDEGAGRRHPQIQLYVTGSMAVVRNPNLTAGHLAGIVVGSVVVTVVILLVTFYVCLKKCGGCTIVQGIQSYANRKSNNTKALLHKELLEEKEKLEALRIEHEAMIKQHGDAMDAKEKEHKNELEVLRRELGAKKRQLDDANAKEKKHEKEMEVLRMELGAISKQLTAANKNLEKTKIELNETRADKDKLLAFRLAQMDS